MERTLRLAALRQMHFLPVQESTCQQVQQCMQAGAGALLQKLFKDYLLMRLDTRQRARGKARNAPANGSTTELPVILRLYLNLHNRALMPWDLLHSNEGTHGRA